MNEFCLMTPIDLINSCYVIYKEKFELKLKRYIVNLILTRMYIFYLVPRPCSAQFNNDLLISEFETLGLDFKLRVYRDRIGMKYIKYQLVNTYKNRSSFYPINTNRN